MGATTGPAAAVNPLNKQAADVLERGYIGGGPKTSKKDTPASPMDSKLLIGLGPLVDDKAAFRQRGPRWSRIAQILGLNDPRIVKRRYKDALVRLYYRL